MKPLRHLLLLALAASSLTLSAADWPQWRGPNRDDHSPDKSILTTWPADGPKQLWTYQDGGMGYSGFSIVGDKLFTMGSVEDEEKVICLDAKTGKKVWAETIDERTYQNKWGNGPRCTPTIDGDRAYALSGNGILACLSTKDGKVVWKADLVKDLGGKLQQWGYTESPLVDGPRVICTPGGGQGTLAALDKMTGKVIWQTKDITEEAQYSSPIIANAGSKEQYYIQRVGKKVFGVKPDDGKVLWQGDFPGKVAVIPTPIYHDGQVYLTAGYGTGSRAFKVSGGSAELAWENDKMTDHHGGVILVDGYIYGHSDKGGWTCQDWKTGEIKWQDRSLGKGACTWVAGHLVCIGEDKGTVVLAEVSPQGWKEKGRFTLAPQTTKRKPDGRIWVHPVVLNGRLYLRDQEIIHCYDVKGQ